MSNKKICKKNVVKIVRKILLFFVGIFALKKINLIFMPKTKNMVEFQFGLITVSTVFAGFSFSVLGMLLGMSSETVMKKLKDTSIVTQKSDKIIQSIMFFCSSGFISLLFIIRIDQYIENYIPSLRNIIEYVFLIEIIFLFIGIVYFVISTWGVFKLIEKIYSYNALKYQIKEKEYRDEIKRVERKLEE